MRTRWFGIVAGVSLIATSLQIPVRGATTITPYGDTYTARNSPDAATNYDTLAAAYNNKSPSFLNRQLQVPVLGFTIGSTPATAVKLWMYAVSVPGTPAGANTNGTLYGKAAAFDETTLTWNIQWGGDNNPDLSTWTNLGALHDLAVNGNEAYSYAPSDAGVTLLTDFYNAHLNQQVEIVLINSTPINSTAATWASKERSGGTQTPYLEVVPEPATLLAVGFGLLPLLSRRVARRKLG